MTYDQARTTLLANGTVTLEGQAPLAGRVLSVLVWVLVVLTIGLAVGSVVMIIVAFANGIFVNPIGFGVPVMAAGLVVLVFLFRRRHKRLMDRFRMPVSIARNGILLRGIGPIPWHGFLPPTHKLVSTRYSDGVNRRAVLPLTQSGFHNVNALPMSERTMLGASKPSFLRRGPVDHIEMPAIRGLSSPEAMQLIAEAHHVFTNSGAHAA